MVIGHSICNKQAGTEIGTAKTRVVEKYSIVLNIVSNVLFYINYVGMSEMLSGLLTAPGWTPDITSRSTLHTCKAREEVMTGRTGRSVN